MKHAHHRCSHWENICTNVGCGQSFKDKTLRDEHEVTCSKGSGNDIINQDGEQGRVENSMELVTNVKERNRNVHAEQYPDVDMSGYCFICPRKHGYLTWCPYLCDHFDQAHEYSNQYVLTDHPSFKDLKDWQLDQRRGAETTITWNTAANFNKEEENYVNEAWEESFDKTQLQKIKEDKVKHTWAFLRVGGALTGFLVYTMNNGQDVTTSMTYVFVSSQFRDSRLGSKLMKS